MARTLREQIGKRDPFADPCEEAYLQVVRTYTLLHAGVEALMKSHGLSAAGYNVLRILRGEGRPMPSLDVARRLVAAAPDITRLVDRLERDGLVARDRSDADRRVVRLRLTGAGRRRLQRIDRELADLHRGQLGHVPRAELARLARLLERARAPHEEG